MFFFQIDRKNNATTRGTKGTSSLATTILLNNKKCKEIQGYGHCQGSWKYLTKFSGNSTYQCAETHDDLCRFYKNDILLASCDYEIEDGSYYSIACQAPSQNKGRISCCSIEHPGLKMTLEWGTDCGLRKGGVISNGIFNWVLSSNESRKSLPLTFDFLNV